MARAKKEGKNKSNKKNLSKNLKRMRKNEEVLKLILSQSNTKSPDLK